MFKKLILAVLLVAVSISAYAGSKWNNNNTEPVFNARTIVTKTAAYTATVSDDYIKVTTSTADLTVTLPAISTLATNGLGSKAYKIEKTDATNFLVKIAPSSTANTIDGTTGYVIANQSDFVVISATAGSTDWVVSYADDVVDTNVVTGAVTMGGPVNNLRGSFSLDTDNVTLTTADCGSVRMTATDAKTYTLPATVDAGPGCMFTFVATAADGAVLITITPPDATSADGIYGTVVNAAADAVFTGTDDGDVTLTKATMNKGDYLTIVSDGVTGWFVVGGVGIWVGA